MGSQSRTFHYSSLSRLTSATNPESGTVSYQYDNNGNLTLKTDARNIVTCFGNWANSACDSSTLGYDGLNRPGRRPIAVARPR
jgi:YD repeat-containing protein